MQTAYKTEMEIALEGQIANIGPRSIIHRAAEEEIPFGRAVIPGTNPDKQCLLPSAAADLILGVSTHTHAREITEPTKNDMINIMRQGSVYVRPEDAVEPGDPVFVRFAANGEGKTPGQFRTDDDKVDDAATAVQLASARWGSSAEAGQLALLEINLP